MHRFAFEINKLFIFAVVRVDGHLGPHLVCADCWLGTCTSVDALRDFFRLSRGFPPAVMSMAFTVRFVYVGRSVGRSRMTALLPKSGQRDLHLAG
jgi:hypothetical protein